MLDDDIILCLQRLPNLVALVCLGIDSNVIEGGLEVARTVP